jgi:protease-4
MKRAFALAGLLCATIACEARPRVEQGSSTASEPQAPSLGENRVLEFDVSTGAPEATGGGLFAMPATRTFAGLVRALQRGLEEKTTSAVFVKLGGQAFTLAQAEEVGGLLERYTKKKIPVVCHGHTYVNSTAAMALRGCTRRWLSPAGSLDSIGIAAQLVYMKGLFDKLHVEVDMLHMGRYKSGAEPLTREGPSDDARANLTETLGAIRQGWLASAGESEQRVLLEQGPFAPEEAKANGLVHSLGFETEALAEARKLGGVEAVSVAFGPRAGAGKDFDISEIVRVISGAEEGSNRPHVAIVPAEGSIAMEPGGPFDSGGISYRALSKTLKKLSKDDSVKAVVLRIDSPGGSALASDLLWHEVMEIQKKKPVVASVGGMAASGGYYIACAAQRIFAEPTSIVGSIGVFGGKIVFAPALAEFGVNTFTFPASPAPGADARATYLSPFSRWDDATRERVQAQLKGVYDLFVARVAAARKLPNETVNEHAQGRIYGAAQALDRKLIDQLGGLESALAEARKLAKLEDDAPVTVEGASESLLELLTVGEDASEAEIAAAVARVRAKQKLGLEDLPERLRPFAAALGPLLEGERVVAAVPFAVSLE